MSVYNKENPNYLKESINSMLQQTVKPDEIVIVKDGPLTEGLELVLKEFSCNICIKYITLEHNLGLGRALEIGLEHCSNEFVARMDTDDISLNNRCEKQLEYFQVNPNLSMVGTAISEFINDPSDIVSCRRVPTNDREIKEYLKTRSPFNHPSVMFKKTEVQKAGSYKHWYLNEDYYLWIRMFLNNCEFANIDEPLVSMRINEETFLRRGGWDYFMTQKKIFDYMLEKKVINIFLYCYNNLIRFITRLLIPNKMRKWLYKKVLRS